MASRCHKRFQRDFLGIGNDGRNNERQAAMATQGYTQSYPVDHAWYMDTGATDHLTSELGKLSSRVIRLKRIYNFLCSMLLL
jgi:hypothetical protein